MKGHARQIIAALESGAEKVSTISQVTGIEPQTVRARLADLKHVGAVHAYRFGRGRSPARKLATEQEKRYALVTA